ncbi:hypothetical protein [Caldimonas tepidiphila]|uniref:hypothetical protein n=1 Tax=Caldimonas tepidiphila TaxID=2315841 RepID=UPI000E5B8C28|nr:hypothetical protein [Caldimonas tepidiphila]
MKKSLAALGALCVLSVGAQAGEIYGNVGLPGVMLGYAQPLSSSLTVRADVATLGSHEKSGKEEGVDYTGKIKVQRTGVFADWFPFQGGFRLTGGMTFNDIKASLSARGDGSFQRIGDTDYRLDADDRFDVEISFPRTTPYLGIGYGHQLAKGLGFVFDLGASLGKAKVSVSTSGDWDDSAEAQRDIERERQELSDGVGKIRVIPQISIGLNYRF